MNINIPKLSLVVLIGPSGAGKSSFAKKHFSPYEIVSSDECRGMVCNDENSQAVSKDAFDLLYYIIEKRLKRGLLTVVDSTALEKSVRKKLVRIAKYHHVIPVALHFDITYKDCIGNNEKRVERVVPRNVIADQYTMSKDVFAQLKREGFRQFERFTSLEEVKSLDSISRVKLPMEQEDILGPFDIIGDIHGCYDELKYLLETLEYTITFSKDSDQLYGITVTHKENRKVIFLGDLVDRGPKSPEVLRLVMSMVQSGQALCILGNHDYKLFKKLNGKNVSLTHGLAETVAQLDNESEEFCQEVKEFIAQLPYYLILDEGRLVVSHGGIKKSMVGRESGAIHSFCLYGDTKGELDCDGLPIRYNWAEKYDGTFKIVYGHTPVKYAQWLNNTINVDTGCVFGGKLTALRYPEELPISVKAKECYCESVRPLV